MNALVLSTVACVIFTAEALPYVTQESDSQSSYPFTFVTRDEWGARPPRSVSKISGPVHNVLVHHSFIPGACYTQTNCSKNMRQMQIAHQNTNGWVDIGYNFGVGGDGSVYEGRGWGHVGAHATGWNSKSVGIVFIGDFVSTVPPENQIATAQALIAAGVQLGHIAEDYKLIGHRQVSSTECPGGSLFNEIQTWDRFTSSL